MIEIWVPIKEYSDEYLVSNLGKIKSVKYNKILKPFKRGEYLAVRLYKKGKHKDMMVHRIVANEFLTKINKKCEVNHLDGNKSNNCVDNLEWCTHSNNIKHAYRTGLMKTTQKQRDTARKNQKQAVKATSKHIVQYDLKGNILKEWNSIAEANRALGKYGGSHIGKVCKGQLCQAYGYVWKYKEEI